MKLSKSGIFLIIILVIAIGLGAWVTVMTCGVLAKDPITLPDRGSAAGTPATARSPRSRPGAILTAILIKAGLPGRFPAWWSI